MSISARRMALAALLFSAAFAAQADNTPQTLPFSQNWSSTGQVTVNDVWSGVPGIEGYLGQDITTTTATDPRTLTGTSASANDLDVIANQANPNTNFSGGVGEFDGIANPVVALQGSGNADAPYLLLHLNTTGQNGINVAYNLRDIDGSADNSVQPVALQYRVGNSGNFINVPAGFVSDASTGPSLATLVTAVSATLPAEADNQPLVQVRIITTNAASNDEWIGVDDIAVTGGGVAQPSLTITNTSAAEGDSGTTAFMFTIGLSELVGNDVTVEYTTADDTATAGSDYAAKSGTATILAGSISVTISVDVNGDTGAEPNETFFVNLSNPVGAIIADAQGVGTISNDDVTLTAIHTIQGNGATSPIAGQAVTARGIVTGRKSNGFFIQAADADADVDPATSEGIFVFTSTTPPVEAAVGTLVQVDAFVSEYIPSADPGQLPLTELSGAAVTVLSTGHALPTPVPLTTSLPDPAGALGQLEHLEGMRVTADSFTVVAPTGGNVSENNATSSSNGIFSVVVTGTPRPFREPGIQVPDPDPSGSTATSIPRWDFNPELLTVDSDAIGAPTLNLQVGTTIQGMTGPLDYGFRRYALLPEQGGNPSVTPPFEFSAVVREPSATEFTVASYNLERFFDDANDPNTGEPVLTATAYANRLNKASLGIRQFLHSPDIVALAEVENLTTLQALAAKINADSVANSQPDPQYVAYLEEGNDVGGIDVGFLVKTADAGAGISRVETKAVTQVGKDATWTDPSDNASHLLNDRPPLLLQAIVHFADGGKFPISVLAVHQRSLNGAASEAADGLTTEGNRVRRKRLAQAEFLANYIQQRQTDDAGERLVVLGDFNAFEFNDGYVDAMNVVTGTPTPDNETAVPGDGIDLVDPDLINLSAFEDEGQHYSFVFGGNAQSLDQVLVNLPLAIATNDVDLDHARINADQPETLRGDANSAMRLADHDPAIAYFDVPPLKFADLSIVASNTISTLGMIEFRADLSSAGPDIADYPAVGLAFNAVLPDLVVSGVPDWTCDQPQIANGMTSVACTRDWMATDTPATFWALIKASNSTAEPIRMTVAASTQSNDTNQDNNSSTTLAGESSTTNIATSWIAPSQVARSSTSLSATARLSNVGQNVTTLQPVLVLTADVAATAATVTTPFGWTCKPFDSPAFKAYCYPDSGVSSSGSLDFAVQITNPGRPYKPEIRLKAEVLSFSNDANHNDNTAEAVVQVVGSRF